jgi:hypothetical protein
MSDLPGTAFIGDQSAAPCEDGSEVSHRRELPAADQLVRSLWGGHVSRDVGCTGRCHTAGTGGGAQLVTVVAPSAASLTATFTAWAKGASGCWSPVSFAGQPAQPFRAQTGHGGLLPIARRVPGDWATPTGLFAFGTTVYGNSPVSPTTRYPYHHLICGDWWDEQPGSPTYDTFQHVPCGTTPPYGEDSEALWTEIQPYRHFIDITMPPARTS